jgi:CubicO group peptidase (beta-lactamase class C family)
MMQFNFSRAHWFCSLLLLLIINFGEAQDVSRELDSLMQKQFKPNEPGAVALVIKNGTPIYRKAFGMADLEHNVQMTPEHVFGIGSMTKQFTAVGILMLMEQGSLSPEDSITKFINDYPTKDHVITIHHLLTHTSGVKSYTEMEKWRKIWRNDLTVQEMMDVFKNEPMDFAPGEEWHYSNSGYFLLGVVIEKVSGMSYGEFVEKSFFEPLEMKNTYYGSRSRIIPNRAMGYQRGREYRNAEYLSHTQPFSAGAIMSTVDDLSKWQRAIQNNALVKRETIEKAFTNHSLNNGKPTYYGYGWALDEINGSFTREHSGGIFGYSSNGIYLPKEDVYVVVLSNCNCNSPVEVSTRMAAAAIGKPYPKLIDKVNLDEKYAKSLVGIYNFEDGSSREITLESGQLYSQRAGSNTKLKIFSQSKTSFVFETGLTSLHFVLNKGKVKGAVFKDRIVEIQGKKVETKVAK